MEGELAMKRLGIFCMLVGLAAMVAPAAHAATRTPKVSYGTSCIDRNRDDVCTYPADVKLGDALDANGMYRDATNTSSNLIVQGDVSLSNFIYLQVNGDILISGNVKMSGDDVGATIETLKGNVTIAPKTTFNITDSLSLQSYSTQSTFEVGTGTSAKVSGDTVDFELRSNGSMHIGAGQNWTISGGGYANVEMYGLNGMQLDPLQSFRGSNHGLFSIDAGSDLDMSHVNWKAGYVLINVTGSDAHPGPRHLTIRDSTLNQIYKNGNMKIYADTDRNNGALGRIDITNSTLIAKDPDGGIVSPLAHCDATTVAPTWVCL